MSKDRKVTHLDLKSPMKVFLNGEHVGEVLRLSISTGGETPEPRATVSLTPRAYKDIEEAMFKKIDRDGSNLDLIRITHTPDCRKCEHFWDNGDYSECDVEGYGTWPARCDEYTPMEDK